MPFRKRGVRRSGIPAKAASQSASSPGCCFHSLAIGGVCLLAPSPAARSVGNHHEVFAHFQNNKCIFKRCAEFDALFIYYLAKIAQANESKRNQNEMKTNSNEMNWLKTCIYAA